MFYCTGKTYRHSVKLLGSKFKRNVSKHFSHIPTIVEEVRNSQGDAVAR